MVYCAILIELKGKMVTFQFKFLRGYKCNY